MKRLIDRLRWPWWTVTTARHRPHPWSPRPGTDDQWQAWINDQAAADRAEEGRHG